MDAEMPDSVIGTLQGIMAAASQITSSGEDDPAGPHYLDLRVAEILAAELFSEQDAAEKLVRDALHD